jgi:hypothetical protein
MEIQSILDKYTPVNINSLNIEKDVLDIEKDIIFEKESQVPNLVSSSNRPFDKNYCFYDLPLIQSTRENIFPKFSYRLKYKEEIKPLDVDSLFDNKNDILQNISDNELRNKKLEIIKKEQYKEYIPKIKMNLTLEQVYSQEKNNKWYIFMENEKIGPFNDFNLYKKIRDIYLDCFQQKKQIPYYLIKEEKGEIYLTMEECFQRLNKQFYKEIQKNIKNSGYGNTVFYPQMNFPFYFPQNNNIIINNNNILVKTNDINPEKNKEEVKQEIKEIDPDEFFEK